MSDQLCIYCRERVADSEDHVPPENIFVDVAPSKLLTVPSCKHCNSSFSMDDEYFMVFLAMIANTKKNNHKDKLFEKVKRIKLRERSRGFYTYLQNSREFRNVVLPSGLVVLNQPGLVIDESRIRKVIDRIVYGLVYKNIGRYSKTIHTLLTTEYGMFDQEMNGLFSDMIELSKPIDRVLVDDGGVFMYKFTYPRSRPDFSFSILTFFETYHILALAEHEK